MIVITQLKQPSYSEGVVVQDANEYKQEIVSTLLQARDLVEKYMQTLLKQEQTQYDHGYLCSWIF